MRGAVFYYVSFRDPWSAEAPAGREITEAVMPGCEHVMEYHMLAKGGGWATISGHPPVKLSAGDIVMFPHGDAHILSSAPGMEPFRLTPQWIFSTRDAARPLPISYHHGVLKPGTPMPIEEANTVAVCGFFGCDLTPFNPLISALPRILHLPATQAGTWISRIIEQAVIESNNPRPGADAVLERLSEMMFVDAARRYLDTLPDGATGWLAGLRDRYVGKALALIHERPEHRWTLDILVREVGLSRSALHDRFVGFLGQAPMQYLAKWRIQYATRLLRETRHNVATVALDVGYESEAAFTRAFKRLVGVPPAAWRKTHSVSKNPAAPPVGDSAAPPSPLPPNHPAEPRPAPPDL